MDIRSLLQLVKNPVRPEITKRLKQIWYGLKSAFHPEQRMLGTHQEGCGSTIGVMPKCDFACKCSYLGKETNKISQLPIENVQIQLSLLQQRLVYGETCN